MPETMSPAARDTDVAPAPPTSRLRQAAAGAGIALLVGGSTGILIRLLMRAAALVLDHDPSLSIAGTVAIVLLFAIGLMPAAVLLSLGLRTTGLLVLVATTLLHLSQVVVVGLDEGAAALIENLSPLTAAIVAAFLIAPPLAALSIWRLTAGITRR